MDIATIVDMLQNVTVLLAFSIVYDYAWKKDEEIQTIKEKIIAGLLVGVIGGILIMIPYGSESGIIIDSRTVLLAVSGLFFGSIPTVIGMLIMITQQFLIDGDSLWMGIAYTMIAGFSGMVWRQFFPVRKIKNPFYNILILGFIIHMLEIGTVVFLPKEMMLITLKNIALPLLLIYPLFTGLLGILLLKRWQTWYNKDQSSKEELQYRALFENAGEAIVVSQQGKITFANKRLSDILEIGYDELRSKPFVSFIHPDDRDLVYQRHTNRVKGVNVPGHYSFRIQTKSKQVLWVDINSVYFEWNGVPASLSFLSDVTERRKTERQLVLAKNKAEESDKLKSIFLANMSHEVRTPMNAILGFSELLSLSTLSEEKKVYYISMIQTAGKQLLHIINDIVDVSKLEVNQLRLNKQDVKLYDIYKQSIEVLKSNPLFKEKKDVNLLLDLPSTCRELKVHADPYRIRQILDNLLSNAIKYTDKGDIKFGCSLEKKKNTVLIKTYIQDTGVGIPDSKKDIIFKRFRQVEENHYREGAGLGLSITRGILDLMGGELSFESTVGKGSTFFFSLELDKAKESQTMNNQVSKSIPDLKGLNIYIAEDDLTSFFLIKEYLSESGALVSHAKDGEALMSLLDKKVPDLLMLDINMPKKDGFTCLEEIRHNKFDIKIIAQTAYAMENEKDRCLASGCQGYVSKPIDPDILFEEIKKVLNG